MSNVIDLFEDDKLRASEVFELLAEKFEGQDDGVACVALCFSADRPRMLITGNVDDWAIGAILGTAVVQLAADQMEEPDVLH